MVLNLMLIGLGITLVPFPLTGFVLVLIGLWVAGNSIYLLLRYT